LKKDDADRKMRSFPQARPIAKKTSESARMQERGPSPAEQKNGKSNFGRGNGITHKRKIDRKKVSHYRGAAHYGLEKERKKGLLVEDGMEKISIEKRARQ